MDATAGKECPTCSRDKAPKARSGKIECVVASRLRQTFVRRCHQQTIFTWCLHLDRAARGWSATDGGVAWPVSPRPSRNEFSLSTLPMAKSR